MPRWYLNTYIVAVISTASFASFSALTGYTFAKYMSWGRNLMLVIFLSATMIQTELMIIPWYFNIAKLKCINSYVGMMMPRIITTFGIFVIASLSQVFQC